MTDAVDNHPVVVKSKELFPRTYALCESFMKTAKSEQDPSAFLIMTLVSSLMIDMANAAIKKDQAQDEHQSLGSRMLGAGKW